MTINEKDRFELTVLMPCLNEAESIEFCINEAKEYMDLKGINGEVLIADNGSTDGSVELAESLGARVVHVEDKGYGNALIGGINNALGTYIIMGDCDGSYDFGHLDQFIAELRGGADLVMGNRFKGGIEKDAMPFSHKYLGVPVLSFIGRVRCGLKIGDFHCGLRGFRRDSVLKLGLCCGGMEFASEMVCRFAAEKMTVKEVPTILRKDRRGRKPHLRSIPDGLRHLKILLFKKF